MADLKLAFYGCGLIAEHHMVAVKRCQEAGVPVRVVACVDIDATRAAKLCSLSGSDSMDPDPSAMHRDATVDPGWRVTCFLGGHVRNRTCKLSHDSMCCSVQTV